MTCIAITCVSRDRLKTIWNYLVPTLVVFVGAYIPPLAGYPAAIGIKRAVYQSSVINMSDSFRNAPHIVPYIRHTDFQSVALPTELFGHLKRGGRIVARYGGVHTDFGVNCMWQSM